MKIEHIAIWVKDLEKTKQFYTQYFNMSCGEKYHNPKKNFSSYFLSFESGARIEIIHQPDVSEKRAKIGFAHLAISLGSKEKVMELTEKLRNDNYAIFDEPRRTGDGYFESVILDPEGNQIELTV